jgi:hypothetical protein
MDREEVLRRAREAGLVKAAEEYPEDVVAAAKQAEDIASKLPRDIEARAEPAHVYRIPRLDPR